MMIITVIQTVITIMITVVGSDDAAAELRKNPKHPEQPQATLSAIGGACPRGPYEPRVVPSFLWE